MELFKDIKIVTLSEFDGFKSNLNNFLSSLECNSLKLDYINTLDEYDLKNKDKYNVFIINKKKYSDIDILNLINNINSKSEIIIITSSENYYEIFNKVYKYGIVVMMRPISINILLELIKLSLFKHYKKLKNNNYKNLIDIAKSLLIINMKLNENEAHKYLEKESMNLRCSMDLIAKEIINNNLKVD